MSVDKSQRRAVLSWLYVCPLFVLCGILGYLQYHLIGQVHDAVRERMHGSLQANLGRISQEFDSEIAAAAAAMAPVSFTDLPSAEQDLRTRLEHWKQTARHTQIFDVVALAVPHGETLDFHGLDPAVTRWPASLLPLKARLERNLAPRDWDGPGGPPADMRLSRDNEGNAMEVPLFAATSQGPFGRREIAWIILQVNGEYLLSTLLPEILPRHLGANGSLDYQVEVVSRASLQSVLYRSDADTGGAVIRNADASVSLFDPQYDQMAGRSGRGGRGRGPGTGRGPSPDAGRWIMYVRHRAGSLEAVASRARLLNLAVTGGLLALMVATLFALIRSIRRSQQLADLQMEFVAGVSHELRTPLTVIHTAAYNLRGKLSNNPAQVERYGELIQQESGRLKEIVENVLQFSSVQAGRVIQEREPVSVESVIEQAVESAKPLIAGAQCTVEKNIAPGLPKLMGDPLALRQALANLVGNAAKYGGAPDRWIGIFARRSGEAVEIRVVDRGPGIPSSEQAHIFDPFFRGARAVQDQVHGTGLGLSLVKKIVEAHGGTIRVKSEPMKGSEFIMTIPTATNGAAG